MTSTITRTTMQLPIAIGGARKSLSDDLRAARLALAIIRRRQRRGDYAGEKVNFIAMIEVSSEANCLAHDLRAARN